ncbi:MAG: hypothetical protein LBL35_00595, partial [Clostridiales bacterium]|nr:hypothetical protein [Clostridiales bacterium]
MATLTSRASAITPARKYIRNNRKRKMKRAVDVLITLALPVALLTVWQVASVKQIFPPIFIPPLKNVILNFADQIRTGLLCQDLKVSMIRVVQGYAIGASLGVALGVLMGISATLNRLFFGLLNGIRQI